MGRVVEATAAAHPVPPLRLSVPVMNPGGWPGASDERATILRLCVNAETEALPGRFSQAGRVLCGPDRSVLM
jgi:hypothetical protein